MIQDAEQAVDEMYGMVKLAWDEDPRTSQIPVLWDTVAADVPGQLDHHGNPTHWLGVEHKHYLSTTTSLRGPNGAVHENEGTVIMGLRIQTDRGMVWAEPYLGVLYDALQGKRSPNGVRYRNVQRVDIGRVGAWYIMSVTADFFYDLIR